jgi:hypothetical protein
MWSAPQCGNLVPVNESSIAQLSIRNKDVASEQVASIASNRTPLVRLSLSDPSYCYLLAYSSVTESPEYVSNGN